MRVSRNPKPGSRQAWSRESAKVTIPGAVSHHKQHEISYTDNSELPVAAPSVQPGPKGGSASDSPGILTNQGKIHNVLRTYVGGQQQPNVHGVLFTSSPIQVF